MMEEALAGIYRGKNERDFETFRSYFSRDELEDASLIGEDDDDPTPFGGTGDYEDPSPQALQARYGARSVALKEDSEAPKVVRVTADNNGVEPEAAEDDDILADVLDDDPSESPEGDDGLDGDLRSLFEEVEEVHSVPEAVRKAIPEVSISALVADAREIFGLIGGAVDEAAA
jgi:hypothetical protein